MPNARKYVELKNTSLYVIFFGRPVLSWKVLRFYKVCTSNDFSSKFNMEMDALVILAKYFRCNDYNKRSLDRDQGLPWQKPWTISLGTSLGYITELEAALIVGIYDPDRVTWSLSSPPTITIHFIVITLARAIKEIDSWQKANLNFKHVPLIYCNQ